MAMKIGILGACVLISGFALAEVDVRKADVDMFPTDVTYDPKMPVFILIGVDLVLGPLLTLIVYKQGKPGLKFDLSFIAAVQVAALIYGSYTLHSERPHFLVFAIDRVTLVALSGIDESSMPLGAKMADMGQEFFYYENMEGGHGGTANQEQLAMRTALEYAYFIRMLMPAVWDSKPE